jgi:hypothetical protein
MCVRFVARNKDMSIVRERAAGCNSSVAFMMSLHQNRCIRWTVDGGVRSQEAN